MASLTGNAVSATAPRMPKQKLEDVMTVRFARGDFDRIDAVAGENRRAAYIRKATLDALAKDEKAKRPAAKPPRP